MHWFLEEVFLKKSTHTYTIASLGALKKGNISCPSVTEPGFLDLPGYNNNNNNNNSKQTNTHKTNKTEQNKKQNKQKKTQCQMREFRVSEILLFTTLDCKVQYSRKYAFFLTFLQNLPKNSPPIVCTNTNLGIKYSLRFFESPLNIFFNFLFHGATVPNGSWPLHCRGFAIILRHTTRGRAPLDEWSARCRELYLIRHSTHNRYLRPNGGIQTHNPNKRLATVFAP
jgi:hypothetical protein